MPSRRSVQILLLVAVLLAGLFFGMPLVIKHFALKWLQDNGGEQVSVDNVEFNPFTGRLQLRGLEVKVDDTTTLAFASAEVNAAWWPLVHKQLELQSLTLRGLTLLVDRRPPQPRIGGIRLPESKDEPKAENPWSAGLDTLVLDDVKLRYLDDRLDLTLHLQRLRLDRLAQWTAETATPIEAQGSLNQGAFKLSGEIAPLAKLPRYDLQLELKAVPLAPFAQLAADHAERLAGKLSYDGNLHYEKQSDGFQLRQSGQLNLDELDLALRQPALTIKTRSARLESELGMTRGAREQPFQLSGELQFDDADVSTADGAVQLLAGEKLRIAGLDMTGADTLSFKQLTADKLVLARQPDETPVTLLQAGRLDLDSLALKNKRLQIDRIALNDVTSQLHRDAEGNWQIAAIGARVSDLGEPAARVKSEVDSAVTTPKEAAQGKTPAAAADGASRETESASNSAAADQAPSQQPAMTFRIGQITVEGDSHVKLRDDAVKPGLDTDIAVKTLQLEALDSATPDQPSPVDLKATIDSRTGLSLQGSLRPFQQPPAGDVQARISALDLPPLSPYARESLGLNLTSGTLDADIEVKSDASKLDGLIKLDLYRLGVENVGGANSLQSRLPVPINVALDTLRDSNDTISLKIPISGDPANPDFDIDSLIAKALADGLQKGTLTYLTLALQPYGAIVMAARYAGEQIKKVRLNPVAFAAGNSELNATAHDYLAKVAKVMQERPKLTVKVCGVAVNADLAYLKQQNAAAAQGAGANAPAAGAATTEKVTPAQAYKTQLGKLAEKRANSVRDYLVNKYKTKASHLVSCQPRIETSGDSKPRTDLLL